MREPSREFKAFFTVLSVVWVVCIMAAFVAAASILPDERPHEIRSLFLDLFIFAGVLFSAVMPLFWIWQYVISEDE